MSLLIKNSTAGIRLVKFLTQSNLQRDEEKLAGLDILKSEFHVTEAEFMAIKVSRSKSTRL